MLPPPPEDWLKGNKNFRMHYIQVHYCNWVENWKSLKRFLRVRSCDWSCRNWDIGTRSDRPPTLGEAQRKCLIWSADHVWKIAARFFFCFFYLHSGFEWIVASIEFFCLTLYCHLVVAYHQNISAGSQVQRLFFFNPTATNAMYFLV